jgi:hypothetical protein
MTAPRRQRSRVRGQEDRGEEAAAACKMRSESRRHELLGAGEESESLGTTRGAVGRLREDAESACAARGEAFPTALLKLGLSGRSVPNSRRHARRHTREWLPRSACRRVRARRAGGHLSDDPLPRLISIANSLRPARLPPSEVDRRSRSMSFRPLKVGVQGSIRRNSQLRRESLLMKLAI